MTKLLDAGRRVDSHLVNEAVADQVLNAADSYLLGSRLDVAAVAARASLRWRMWLTKTAAGVAAPSFKIRLGSAGGLTDTSRLALAGPAQTAAADAAYVEIVATFRAVGEAAVIAAVMRMTHNLDSTGFAVLGTPTVVGQSAAFDSTRHQPLQAGLSVDPGAAGVWTVKGLISELIFS
jgi:hypothetical protein